MHEKVKLKLYKCDGCGKDFNQLYTWISLTDEHGIKSLCKDCFDKVIDFIESLIESG